jgi:uncharacterized protein with GYD domain
MVTTIVLMKFTDKGVVDINNSPRRIAEAMKLWDSMGGRTIGVYLTMGDYDLVAIGEGPDEQTAAKFALALSAAGTVRTTTLPAFGLDDARRIIEGVPENVLTVA